MAIDHGYMAEEALRDLLVWDLLVRWDLLDLLVLSNPIGYVGSSRQIQPAPQDLPVLSQIYRRRSGVPGLHFKTNSVARRASDDVLTKRRFEHLN